MNSGDKVTSCLLKWFEKYRRSFLWRNKHISLYKLLACEAFLWKTQAETVSDFLPEFFNKYPSPIKIKNRSLKLLSKDIKRLGLSNRRAKLLKQISFSFGDAQDIPKSENEFRKQFKVGQYIARSILTIRYGLPLFPVDQNVYRFFKRVFNHKIKNIRTITPRDDIFLRRFIIKGKKDIVWAVIDFTSQICKRNNPKCNSCFLTKYCHYCGIK